MEFAASNYRSLETSRSLTTRNCSSSRDVVCEPLLLKRSKNCHKIVKSNDDSDYGVLSETRVATPTPTGTNFRCQPTGNHFSAARSSSDQFPFIKQLPPLAYIVRPLCRYSLQSLAYLLLTRVDGFFSTLWFSTRTVHSFFLTTYKVHFPLWKFSYFPFAHLASDFTLPAY